MAGHIFAGYPHRAGGFHVLDRARRRTLHPADAEQGTAFGLLLRAGGCDRRIIIPAKTLQELLKIIGGAFVVVVGLYIFFQNPVVQIRRNRSGKVSLWRDFLSIFLFTIANPAISLVFVGLFAMFGISNDAGYINGVAMLVGVLAGAAGWWFLFTFVLNIYRKRFRPRYLLWMNRIAGILIILLGVTAIISSLFNIHFDELIPK